MVDSKYLSVLPTRWRSEWGKLAGMSQQCIKTLLGKGVLSSVSSHALWLEKLNSCLQKHLPLSIDTTVKLAGIDARHQAVIHVNGAEWSTQIRLQQGLIKAILRDCGSGEIKKLVVKNRPLESIIENNSRFKPARKSISQSSRKTIEVVADGILDKQLKQSLKRLARKSVE